MAIALFSTAIGGFVMATFPSFLVLQILYAYWGFTTVFLFWGAMIKATRLWGGGKNQGKAFGFLDGGRGVIAASIGSIGVFIFSMFLKIEIDLASVVEKQEAFRYVTVIIIGALVLYFMDNEQKHQVKKNSSIISIKNIKSVLKIKSVWLMMMIIMSAYVGYKLTDIYSLYASEVMLYNQIEAAEIGALQLYLRPLVCLVIGLLADKTSSIRWIIIGFFIMLIGALLFTSGIITSSMNIIFSLSLIITAVGTYAIRALYFAVFNEGRIPLELTGTAVGIISIIGYTPDIFATPIIGYLLDTYPGIIGHQYVCMMLVIFSILGLFASIKFSKLNS